MFLHRLYYINIDDATRGDLCSNNNLVMTSLLQSLVVVELENAKTSRVRLQARYLGTR